MLTNDGQSLLARWLHRTRMRQSDLCRLAGLTAPTLCHVLAGRRYLNPEQAQRVSRITGIALERLVNPRTVVVVRRNGRAA